MKEFSEPSFAGRADLRGAEPRGSPGASGDEAELYRRHHRHLHRAVAHAVNAPSELIEDACQTAWAILLRTQPGRHTIRILASGRTFTNVNKSLVQARR